MRNPGVMRWERFLKDGRSDDHHLRQSKNLRNRRQLLMISRPEYARTNGKYVEICDRKEAIAYAIHHGEPGDIIVLAGKGHEDYQEIKGKKYPMDERVLIAEILKEDQDKNQ